MSKKSDAMGGAYGLHEMLCSPEAALDAANRALILVLKLQIVN
jgi:hypothetical protein